jgi:hypothetical protein
MRHLCNLLGVDPGADDEQLEDAFQKTGQDSFISISGE